MKGIKNGELIQNEEVVKEIQRHRWIESEKSGGDTGFETAARDWLTKYSDAWIKYNLSAPKKAKKSAKRV